MPVDGQELLPARTSAATVRINVGPMLHVVSHYTGLDTNGCPLGNSKFILLSDNLNICLWLSDCQVEKIDQINNP